MGSLEVYRETISINTEKASSRDFNNQNLRTVFEVEYAVTVQSFTGRLSLSLPINSDTVLNIQLD